MRLVLRLQAKRDIQEASEWYEERRPGLRQSFLAAIDESLISIQEYPKIYPRVDPEIRRASVTKFPFGVFYRIDGETIRVIAILHNARSPEIWKNRK
jgi:plasmid stabilization system protein ParE